MDDDKVTPINTPRVITSRRVYYERIIEPLEIIEAGVWALTEDELRAMEDGKPLRPKLRVIEGGKRD